MVVCEMYHHGGIVELVITQYVEDDFKLSKLSAKERKESWFIDGPNITEKNQDGGFGNDCESPIIDCNPVSFDFEVYIT